MRVTIIIFFAAVVSAFADFAEDYLCPAVVPDGKMVLLLPLDEISGKQDAEDYVSWAERTFPRFRGKMDCKWNVEDPFAVALRIKGLGTVLKNGDGAISADGKLKFKVGDQAFDADSATLLFDASAFKGDYSPLVGVTNLWVGKWTDISNRWEEAFKSDGGNIRKERSVDSVIAEISAIAKSEKMKGAVGEIWRKRLAYFFNRPNPDWPCVCVENQSDIAITVAVSREKGEQEKSFAIKPGQSEVVGTLTLRDTHDRVTSGTAFSLSATASGYMEQRKVIELRPGTGREKTWSVKLDRNGASAGRDTQSSTGGSVGGASGKPAGASASGAAVQSTSSGGSGKAASREPWSTLWVNLEQTAAKMKNLKEARYDWQQQRRADLQRELAATYDSMKMEIIQADSHIKGCKDGCDECLAFRGDLVDFNRNYTGSTGNGEYDCYFRMLLAPVRRELGDNKLGLADVDNMLRMALRPKCDVGDSFMSKMSGFIYDSFVNLYKNTTHGESYADILRQFMFCEHLSGNNFYYHLTVCPGCDFCRGLPRLSDYANADKRFEVLVKIIAKEMKTHPISNQEISEDDIRRTLDKFGVRKKK